MEPVLPHMSLGDLRVPRGDQQIQRAIDICWKSILSRMPAMFSRLPVQRLSMPRTSSRRSTSACARAESIKPAIRRVPGSAAPMKIPMDY